MSLKSKPLNQVRAIPAVTQFAMEEVVRINLNVPKSVRDSWKMAAIQRDTTVTQLILDAMKIYTHE